MLIKINMPEVKLDDIANDPTWKKMSEELSRIAKRIANGGGRMSKSFEDSCERLLKIALDGDKLRESIRTRRDIRACTYLWLENPEFIEAHPVNSETLERFSEINPRLGFLPIYHLIQLFFKKYDDCGDLKALVNFLPAKLDDIRNIEAISNLNKLKQRRQIVFKNDSYRHIAERADNENQNLTTVMHDLGIEDSDEGRFTGLTYGFHYINKLKKMGPNDEIPREITQLEVNEMAFEGKLLGHHFIEAICSNVRNRSIEMPEQYLQTILTIAGDPRVPQNTPNYLRWWLRVSPESKNIVYERLSGFDLKLFLEALDAFAQIEGNDDLIRMFPKRRKFLEGLLKQKLIRRTRLFVSRHADEYLTRNYTQAELPSYAIVNDPNTSIIYLKLDNAEIIEGSHMHRFWIYRNIENEQPPTNYNQNYFERQDLSNLSSDETWWTAHNGFWQAKVISRLQIMEIPINPEVMLDDEDYRKYRENYGVR